MLEKARTALVQLLAPNEPLLIGVSGGPDSIALLDALVQSGWRPHICHLNHKLRGADSDADAEFVCQLAQRYQLAVTIEARDVGTFASEKRISLEDAARRARHEFFSGVAVRTGISKLALAHTADDQVETFLLRLLRGAGVPGLVGIWPERQIGSVRVIRPLLKVSRAEVLEYLSAQGLAYREDASNLDRRFTRNRIRHELLPLLEKEFNPAIRDVLLRTAEILRDEDFYLLRHVVQTFYLAACQEDVVNLKVLADYPVAVQRRLLRFWLCGEDENGPRFTFDHIEAVRRVALGDSPGAEIALPDELVVYREYDGLKKGPRKNLLPIQGRWPIQIDGQTSISDLGVQFISKVVGREDLRPAPGEESFDLDSLGDKPFVRTWQEGDRFQPLGMSEAKKLQDLFVDEKVPRRQRGRIPLLCAADGRIAWVVGVRIADPFKVMERTHRILRVRFKG